MSFDVASFLRRYARDYTDVDELYRKAKKLGIVKNREKFQSTIEDSFLDGELFSHMFLELPFKRHWTKIETPRGKAVGLIKWTDNPRLIGR